MTFHQCVKCKVSGIIFSLVNWHVHVACQVPYMEVNMLISFKQKTSAAKVVQVYISKLNTEMIVRLRQLNNPNTEAATRYRKISDCPTKGYACLVGEKKPFETPKNPCPA